MESKGENKACICGQILRGLAKPYECKVFGKVCTPKNPIGSCMVSGETMPTIINMLSVIKKEIK